MNPSRRTFLKQGAMVLVGTSVIPSFLTRAVMAQATVAANNGKKLVVVFQRGAADGLNIVIPHAETSYYSMRPSIAIPEKSVLDLDGFFGLHPSMASLKPLWDKKHLAIVHAVGSPDMTRSHFDAQDYMESGTPGVKATEDGWLNRALQIAPGKNPSHLRAIAMCAQMPRTLMGKSPAIAMNSLHDFRISAQNNATATVADSSFEALYGMSTDNILHSAGHETFEAEKMLKSIDPAKYTTASGAQYPKGAFGDSLRQVAQLLKANVGVQAAFADITGWDHHENEGGVSGQLADRLHDFSQSLAAFWMDMGDKAEDIVLVTMSEFGRTARENGTRGTDHGHANVMLVLGGPVKGGKVFGRWPGLSEEQLNEGRDLCATTDFRQVLGEAAYKQLGARNLGLMFPNSGLHPESFLNILG